MKSLLARPVVRGGLILILLLGPGCTTEQPPAASETPVQLEPLEQEQLTRRDTKPPVDTAKVAEADRLKQEGLKYKDAGQFELASAQFEEAAKLHAEAIGTTDAAYASILHQLACTYAWRGNYKQAQELCQQAIKVFRTYPDHPEYGSALCMFGTCLVHLELFVSAEPVLNEALRVLKRHGSSEDRWCATAYADLAAVYWGYGEHERAMQSFDHALTLLETLDGPHVLTNRGKAHYFKGNLLWAQGRLAEAEREHRNALELREANGDAAAIYQSLSRCAHLFRDAGHEADARQFEQRAAALVAEGRAVPASKAAEIKSLGTSQVACVAPAYINALFSGDFREARLVLMRTIEARTAMGKRDWGALLDERHLETVEQILRLPPENQARVADAYRLGRWAAMGIFRGWATIGKRQLETAIALHAQALGTSDPLYALLLGYQTQVLFGLGDCYGAWGAARREVEIYAGWEFDHVEYALALSRLGLYQAHLAMLDSAESSFRHALRICEEQFTPGAAQCADPHYGLSLVFRKRRQHELALNSINAAITLRQDASNNSQDAELHCL